MDERSRKVDSGVGVPPEQPQVMSLPVPIAMLGVPFDNVTLSQTVEVIAGMVASGRPHYAATANVDFVVQALHDTELRRTLVDADLVLCDGMPLVWASRFLGNRLPERVAGSDLMPLLLEESERRGWRVFFLGGADESLARAAANVRKRHPKLQLVGVYSPPFKPLLEMDHEDIVRRVRAARPDLLFVAFGCPKQEKWISMQFRNAGVPLSIGVGATIDFLGGAVRRAPRWMQQTGLEWVFRLLQEPRRLFKRYSTDLWVFGTAILRQWWQLRQVRSHSAQGSGVTAQATRNGMCVLICFADRVDAATIQEHANLWCRIGDRQGHVILDLSQAMFMDSTGVGLLVRMQKQLRGQERQMILVAPTPAVRRALDLMRLTGFFPIVEDLAAAHQLVKERQKEQSVVVTMNLGDRSEAMAWQGEIVASNAEAVWQMTLDHIAHAQGREMGINISLAAVRFIDSTGVRLMVRLCREARQRGLQVRFTAPQEAVRNVLRILNMDKSLLA